MFSIFKAAGSSPWELGWALASGGGGSVTWKYPPPTWVRILSRHPPSIAGKPEHTGALAWEAQGPAVLCESVSAVLC